MDDAMRSEFVNRDPRIADVVDGTPRAASFFVGPTGEQIGEMLQNEEGIVYADIDINHCVEPKQFHDVVGYYNRFDIFDFSVNRHRHRPASFIDTRDLETARDVHDIRSGVIELPSSGNGAAMDRAAMNGAPNR
jgi:aliphatic nitrilase